MKAISTAVLVLASLATTALAAPNFYNPTIGYKGMYYSAAAYCKYETLDAWNCGTPCSVNGGLQNVYRIHNLGRDTFAFAGWNRKDDQIVLTFRGTNGYDIENWISNVKVLQRSYPNSPVEGAKVHSGFYQAYEEVKDQVRSVMTALIKAHPSSPIFVNGHSLGGALAVFAALDVKLTLNPSNKMTIYTYGQPRTGNEKFSDLLFSKFDGSYIRVTNYDDTVAHIPPLVSYFKHAGNEAWYKNRNYDGIFMECPNQPGITESRVCSNSFWLKTGIVAHTTYFGFDNTGVCNQRQPGGTVLKSALDEEINFEKESFVVDSEASLIKNKLAEAAALQ